METQKLELPWPPSANHYTRYRVIAAPGKKPFVSTYKSAKGQAFQREVIDLYGRPTPLFPDERLFMVVTLCPPDRRRLDIDNRLKPLIDSLEAARLFKNDSQIDFLCVRRGERRTDGFCLVFVGEMETLSLPPWMEL